MIKQKDLSIKELYNSITKMKESNELNKILNEEITIVYQEPVSIEEINFEGKVKTDE